MLLMIIIDDEKNVIAAVYQKNYKKMIYVASRILGENRGEEAVHDAFLTIIEKNLKNISELRDKPALYFVIVVRNHAINQAKRERDELELDEEQVFSHELGPEELLVAKDSEEALVKLIRALKPSAREVLEYKYILGYSNYEIAQLMSKSQTAVSSQIDRAKKELIKKMKERGAIYDNE